MQSAPSQEGRVFGDRYQILEEVGRGGMAVVYKALDLRLQRLVALKLLYPALADRPETRRRFEREALVVSRLAHPNIVQIYDYSGSDSEEKFIVSEFVEGITLKSYMQQRTRLLPELAAMIVEQISTALAHAHAQDVVHRDVKPENVMIGQGTVKLTDFGIAQMVDFEEMTVTGTMVGSPAFMSPEHIEGKGADPRSDVFSLGTLFYHLTVGELPFKGPTAHGLLKNILDARFVPAHELNPAVGDALSAIISKCLRKNPSDRYASCIELNDAIHAHLRSVGLSDECGPELRKFFADEVRTEAVMRLQVVDALLEEARKLSARGATGAALRLLDRGLFLDESRDDLSSEVDSMRQRHQKRRWALGVALIAGGALAVALAVWGVWYSFVADPSSAPIHLAGNEGTSHVAQTASEVPQPAAAAAAGARKPAARIWTLAPAWLGDPDVVSQDDAAEEPAADVQEQPQPRPLHAPLLESFRETRLRAAPLIESLNSWKPWIPRQTLPPAAVTQDGIREKIRKTQPLPVDPKDGGGTASDGGTAAAQTGTVTLEAYPPAVEIRVDGRLLGVGKVGATEMKAGEHVLELHHPSCDVCEDRTVVFQVPPGAATQLKERIGFKPALLSVDAPGTGQVFVNGALVGRLGETFTLPTTTHRPYEVEVKVLFDDGRPSASGTARVQAGTRARISLGPK